MHIAFRKSAPLLLFLCLLQLPYNSVGQYFTSGQDPASIKWRQINSENFQIIYPSDYESQAQKVAHIFEKVYAFAGASLENKPRKISVILHSKVLKSNGFVAWAPSRVELYPTPNQEMYAQNWIEQLAVHELRHHSQIDKIESEMPGIFKVLLGEQAASLIIGAYLPFWFLEGDAVVTETALSHAGRGRMPSFTMEWKAIADEKGIYSLDKAYLGSYKDYIPDYYQLGYQLVSNIRSQNGGEVWGKVLHHIARNPLALNSLSKGLKLYTGKNQDEHYLAIMNNLKSTRPFNFNDPADKIQQGNQLVKASNIYTTYRYPYFVNDSTIVALKDPLNQIPSIILIDKHQKERKIFTPGIIEDESMSYSDGKVIWTEAKPDLRWTNKETSILRILDIKNGKLTEKIFDEKIFAPAVSPDGKSIITVKLNTQNQCSFVLIDAGTLQILNEYKALNDNMYFTPSWSSDQKSIYAVELGPLGKSLIKVTLASGEVTTLTNPSFGEIRKPIQRGIYLYYIADYAGKNDVFAFDLMSNITHRIFGSKYGIKDLQSSNDGNYLLYLNYTSNGFKIEKTELLKTSSWQVFETKDHYQDSLSANLTHQEKGIVDFSSLDTSSYVSEKYIKVKNLINIHSWSPCYVNPDNTTVHTGFSVISQNKLTTAITQFGYDYSEVNRAGKWVGKFVFSGWYPVMNFYGDYGKENSSYYQINKHYSSKNVLTSQDTVKVPYSQKVMNLHLDLAVPLNFSRGKMYRIVEPEFQIGYSHTWQQVSTPSNIFKGSYIPFTYRLYARNVIQQSRIDIQPKWGQVLDLKYRHTPFGDKQLGSIASAEGTIYLPGFLINHGFMFYGGFQRKISANSYFGDLIYYPRGYFSTQNNQLLTLRSDYVLPLINPDWHLWHLYYLKRVSLRVFYDISQISLPIHLSSSNLIKSMNSTGFELLTDCHFLRFIAPIKMGVRESYLFSTKTYSSEFIFSMNLKNM
ncbi:MAG: hypothetical protein WCK18_15585 [Prolixibacteraceae bacterium]